MVAMNVWPTDGADGSVATEARWRKMARHWAASGVIDGVGGELKPTLAFPNLTVQAGAAWADGHFTELLGSQVLTVTANGLVVVRFDPAANTAELVYRDGAVSPAQDPNGVWEVPIAKMVGSAMTDSRRLIKSSQARALAQITTGSWWYTPTGESIGTVNFDKAGLYLVGVEIDADATGQTAYGYVEAFPDPLVATNGGWTSNITTGRVFEAQAAGTRFGTSVIYVASIKAPGNYAGCKAFTYQTRNITINSSKINAVQIAP
jgi:hypothetical protein